MSRGKYQPRYDPFGWPEWQSTDTTIPADLAKLVRNLRTVERYLYAGYPPDLAPDNAEAHQIRLLKMATHLDLNPQAKTRLNR